MTQHQPPIHFQTPRESSRAVMAGIVIAMLLFAVAIGTLAYKWLFTQEPSSAIVVEGSSRLRGTEVTVEGVGLREPHVQVFGEGERFTLPFYLEPGSYKVRVSRNGEELAEAIVDLGAREMRKVDLSRWEQEHPDASRPPISR